MKRITLVVASVALGSVGIGTAQAGELVYTPVNPNFGGNPNNGIVLQQQAVMNNRFKERQAPKKTAQEFMQETIETSVLTAAAQAIATKINESDFSDGQTQTITVGNTIFTLTPNPARGIVTVTSTNPGITTFEVPYAL